MTTCVVSYYIPGLCEGQGEQIRNLLILSLRRQLIRDSSDHEHRCNYQEDLMRIDPIVS